MALAITCPQCSAILPDTYFNHAELTSCPKCEANLQVLVFPAYYRTNTATVAEGLSEATDATCFFHTENRAVVTCESCGRFLCSVCDINLGEQHLCPNCIQQGIQTRKLARLENRRVLYDSIALAVAGLPLLLIWPVIFTAPIATFIAIRYWRAPSSLIPRTKIRAIFAILIALAELVMIGFFIYMIIVSGGVATK